MGQLAGKALTFPRNSRLLTAHRYTSIWEYMFMDHVARQRLNEIRQKQLNSLENHRTTTPSNADNGKSQYLVALGGVAAGLIIAVIALLAKSIWLNDSVNNSSTDSNGSMQASIIRQANTHIDQLNRRIEVLTESINNLETRLTRVMELTDPITDIEMKFAATILETSPTSAGNQFTSSTTGPSVDVQANEISFVPTHIVNAKLNLRPSKSLDTTPIAVLETGTEVEYIKETDNWFYVNTEQHGKGWCASDYLTQLPATQQDTTRK
jgi:hypothetical protein